MNICIYIYIYIILFYYSLFYKPFKRDHCFRPFCKHLFTSTFANTFANTFSERHLYELVGAVLGEGARRHRRVLPQIYINHQIIKLINI